jgi:hypothetical protein
MRPRDPLNTIRWDFNRGFHFSADEERLVFLDAATPTSPHWAGRPIVPEVNPELIKRWLFRCENLHKDGQCCPKKNIIATKGDPSGLKILRVIDLRSGDIVEAPRGCRYVALSYVWGMEPTLKLENKSQTWFKNGLLYNPWYQDLFPLTVRDAVALVGKIGERYLWVDNFCMYQDDPSDVADGIRNMNLTYEGAILTIIAASGTDFNAGLPGVRPGSRNVDQLSQEVKPGVTMGSASAVYELLNPTTYMTRGWTYVKHGNSAFAVI